VDEDGGTSTEASDDLGASQSVGGVLLVAVLLGGRAGGLSRRTGRGAGGAGGASRAGGGRRGGTRTGGGGEGNGGLGLLGGALVGVSLDVTVGVGVVPRRTVEAGVVGLNVNTALDLVELGEGGLGEVTKHLNGTSDGLDLGETVDLSELGVVGDLETTANLLELGDLEVGELRVGHKEDTTANLGELGQRDVLDGVVDVADGVVDVGQVGHVGLRDTSERDVGGPLQAVKLGLEAGGVVGDLERLGHVLESEGNLLEVSVVVDVDLTDVDDVDAHELLDGGVGNDDRGGVVDTLVELHNVEVGQGDPLEVSDGLEGGEGEGGQTVKHLEVEVLADGGQLGGGQRVEGRQVVGLEGAGDLLDSVNGEHAGLTGDFDGTIELLATSNLVEVRLGLDLDVLRAAGLLRGGCRGGGGGLGRGQSHEGGQKSVGKLHFLFVEESSRQEQTSVVGGKRTQIREKL
jgi:hypothetical protein